MGRTRQGHGLALKREKGGRSMPWTTVTAMPNHDDLPDVDDESIYGARHL
jgi:hypothetical protein